MTCLLLLAIYPQTSAAEDSEGFLSRDFLELGDVQKKFWLEGSIDTLTAIAAARSAPVGQCITDWYYGDLAKTNGLILATMKKYGDNYPTAIMIALAERECGKFRK